MNAEISSRATHPSLSQPCCIRRRISGECINVAGEIGTPYSSISLVKPLRIAEQSGQLLQSLRTFTQGRFNACARAEYRALPILQSMARRVSTY